MEQQKFYYKTADEKGLLVLKSPDNSGNYIAISREEFAAILERKNQEINQ